MNLLTVIFATLGIVAAVTGKVAVAIIALFMVLFTRYAKRKFAEQDAAWANEPAHAYKGPDTLTLLGDSACECSGSESAIHFSESDLES